MKNDRLIYILIIIAIILIIFQIAGSRPLLRGTSYFRTGNSSAVSGTYWNPSGTYSQSTTTTTSNSNFNTSTTSFGNTSPFLVLLGDNPDNRTFNGIANYREPGYTATDREDGDITASVKYSDEFDNRTDCSNTWIRTYFVTDRNGATASAKRIITGNKSERACGTVSVDAVNN